MRQRGAEFKDTWTLSDIDNEWVNLIAEKYPALHRVLLAAQTKSDKSYLIYIAVRMLEMRRLLKPSGSVYLHCDPTMSHYLKLVMDAIWGRQNFRNEIIWCYSTSGRSKTFFAKKHDVILLYSLSNEAWKNYTIPVSQKYLDSHYRQFDENGKRCRIRVDAGKKRIYYPEEGMTCNDWWMDIPYVNSQSKERVGYPTQKPLSLLQRIIKASSNEGDMLLDPFCGCATAPVAAEQLGRQWVGIDISPKALDLVRTRLQDGPEKLSLVIIPRTDIPQRTDMGPVPKYNCKENRQWLYGAQSGNCAGCGLHVPNTHQLEVDHIIPKSKGGTDHLENLQLLCGHCNRVKGNRGMEYLLAKMQM
ncbi:MAG: HNH endonuclease [Cellvibrionales bacterium]|nr:HNH endonuclease [Cellvibrionales bacterium]